VSLSNRMTGKHVGIAAAARGPDVPTG
jgi:hypothetical protein